MRSILLPLAFVAVLANAQQRSALFVGNSYTYVNDLPNTVRQLALSLGDTLNVAMSAPGGYTYQDHGSYAPTLDAIASQPWDFVVLQEQSQLGALPFDVTNTDAYAALLVDLIEANDECTYPVFYMTWGRQNGDDLNCPNFPFMCTYDGMQQGLRDNYVQLALENDGYTAPVGAAWKHVRDTHPLINLYQADASHPSPEGTYLAACVFYSTFYHQSCAGASYTASLQADTAAILQAIASATVLDELDTWNLNVASGTDAHITGTSSEAPNEITFYHPGAGDHLWTCSNGQTSTDATPTFTFAVSGSYTFTHTYTDPCGNTDSVTWTLDVTITGISSHSAQRLIIRSVGQGEVEISGANGGISFFDVQGRLLQTERLQGATERVALEPGLMLWRLVAVDGSTQTGRVMVQ